MLQYYKQILKKWVHIIVWNLLAKFHVSKRLSFVYSTFSYYKWWMRSYWMHLVDSLRAPWINGVWCWVDVPLPVLTSIFFLIMWVMWFDQSDFYNAFVYERNKWLYLEFWWYFKCWTLKCYCYDSAIICSSSTNYYQ